MVVGGSRHGAGVVGAGVGAGVDEGSGNTIKRRRAALSGTVTKRSRDQSDQRSAEVAHNLLKIEKGRRRWGAKRMNKR